MKFEDDDDLEIYYVDNDELIIEKIVEDYLEDASLEDFLEEFDITPVECVMQLYNDGLITQEQMQRFIPVDQS